MRIYFFLFLSLLFGNYNVSAQDANNPISIGWSGPLTGNSAVLGIDSVEAVRIAANGTKVAYWQAPRGEKYQEFLNAFIQNVKRPPILELASIPSYDVANLVLEGLNESYTDQDQKIDISKLKQYLYAVKNYEGVSGSITMDADGAVRTIRESVFVYRDGQLNNQE